jgi:hypothetical protein
MPTSLILLNFSRIVIGLAFVASSLSKLSDLGSFEKAVAGFQILPAFLHKISAFMFIFAELIVALVMLLGGEWLNIGFLLAIFLLTVFTGALASVLVRRIRVGCNCFGSTNKTVSHYDVVRNSGFILLGIAGWAGTFTPVNRQINVLETTLLILFALAFVILWINLREIIEVFQGN